MKKSLILGLASIFIMSVNSANAFTEMLIDSLGSQEDKMGICYLFEDNSPSIKAPCVIEEMYGSGGWNAKTYNFGQYTFTAESSEDGPLTLNEDIAKFYQRDIRNYSILDPNEYHEVALGCYRTNQIDFCVKR